MARRLNSNQKGFVVNGVLVSKISLSERHKHKMNGKRDADKGVIHVQQNGYVTSPYIQELIKSYDASIAKLWQTASANASKYVGELRKYQNEFDEALKQMMILKKKKYAAVNNAHKARMGNDDKVENSTLSIRLASRVKKAAAEYDAKINALQTKLDSITKIVAEKRLNAMYESCIEQYEHLHSWYRSKLKVCVWIYLSAAKRKNPKLDFSKLHELATADSVKIAIDDYPREEFYRNHDSYCFNINTRLAQPDFVEFINKEAKVLYQVWTDEMACAGEAPPSINDLDLKAG